MKTNHFFAFFTILFFTLPSIIFARRVPAAQHKLIHFGWWAPSTPAEILNAPLKALDANCPFDGIGLYPNLTLKRGGKSISYYLPRQVGAPQMLTHDDFKSFIPAFLRLHDETTLKHNFMRANSALFNADWFDEDGWKRTLNNFSMLAWFAHETKCDGLCLDIEAYPYTNQPFRYRPDSRHTFEETAAQVRKRGKEWIEELNRQFPNLTLFTFFWTSQCNSAEKADHPEATYKSTTGLQIPFFNGVYDGAPDTMKIVDGNESAGYQAWRDIDYYKMLADFHSFGSAWIDVKNKDKFDKITSVAIALYLDSYIKHENPGMWNLFTHTDNPSAFLYENLRKCLKHTDEYVWMWCERGNFWPDLCKNKDLPFWNDKLPYCVEVIRAAKAPLAADRTYAEPENLLLNPDLVPAGSPNAPTGKSDFGIPGWHSWQSTSYCKGTVKADTAGARLRGVGFGNVSQGVSGIKDGERYILTARCKVESRVSTPDISFFFTGTNGKPRFDLQETYSFAKDLGDGWREAEVVFMVPTGENLTRVTICLGVQGTEPEQAGDNGVLFDCASLRKISLPWNK